MSAPLCELRSVSKTFGATRALRDVSFDVASGEVHVLAGENGAGKSTLIKILSGALPEFEGQLLVNGAVQRFRSPDDAARAKIATIHQELSLVEPMSVVDNLFLGERPGLFSLASPAARLADAKRVLALMELDVDPRTPVERLPLSVRQLVEIARAIARDARVLVMDEPTSALSEPDARRLFEQVRRLRDEGRGVVFISHRMQEIFALADRITVLRDGTRVLTAPSRELDAQKLVNAMVGRVLEPAQVRSSVAHDDALLVVKGLSLRDTKSERALLDGVSFELRAGEVVGVAGLRGSGASELLHTLVGATPHAFAGEARLLGNAFAPGSPREALLAGAMLLPSDRRASVFPWLSVRENASLSSLEQASVWGFVQRKREDARVVELGKRVAITASLEALAGSLSGGNQQKVAIARCLLAQPKLLLCDEPTRGIDVAAKADVHALIRELARQGLGILFGSSELDELSVQCDRVLVFHRGRLVRQLGAGEAPATILALAMGGEPNAESGSTPEAGRSPAQDRH
jgi:ABC-type sugar transport system ATPase subunit